MNYVTIGELLTDEEIINLKYVVSVRPDGARVHNLVMKWLDNHPKVRARLGKRGILTAYAAYLFEHYLQLK